MKKTRILVVLAVFLFSVVGCKTKDTGKMISLDKDKETKSEEQQVQGTTKIAITIQNQGTIEAELDANVAPITVNNFVSLVKKGFYDGLTFHRVINGFMMQGGDPKGNGTGGSDKTIKGEFANNGVPNSLSHVRGVLSMARSNDKNGASSQFFIMHQDSTYLDGDYAAFGKVTSGMEIVDKICQNTPVQDNNGTVQPADQPKIESIKIIK